MSLRDRWEGLSPTLRRALVLGGAVAIVLSMAALLVTAPKDERASGAEERRRLITNLLTEGRGMKGFTAAEATRRIGSAIGRPVDSLWTMRNGYALCTQSGLDAISSQLDGFAGSLDRRLGGTGGHGEVLRD